MARLCFHWRVQSLIAFENCADVARAPLAFSYGDFQWSHNVQTQVKLAASSTNTLARTMHSLLVDHATLN